MRPVIVTDSMVIGDLRLRILPNVPVLSRGGGMEEEGAAERGGGGGEVREMMKGTAWRR